MCKGPQCTNKFKVHMIISQTSLFNTLQVIAKTRVAVDLGDQKIVDLQQPRSHSHSFQLIFKGSSNHQSCSDSSYQSGIWKSLNRTYPSNTVDSPVVGHSPIHDTNRTVVISNPQHMSRVTKIITYDIKLVPNLTAKCKHNLSSFRINKNKTSTARYGSFYF